MSEFKNIKIQVYRDSENNPICAKNFETGEICKFLGARHFGLQSVCMITGEDIHYQKFDENRFPTGYLSPLESCIIWNEEETE